MHLNLLSTNVWRLIFNENMRDGGSTASAWMRYEFSYFFEIEIFSFVWLKGFSFREVVRLSIVLFVCSFPFIRSPRTRAVITFIDHRGEVAMFENHVNWCRWPDFSHDMLNYQARTVKIRFGLIRKGARARKISWTVGKLDSCG